jgi:hypothetical protein
LSATFNAAPWHWQALAGLLAEQGHADEALALLHQSLALWLPPATEAADGEHEGRFAELPSLEFRFDTAKLLLDLDHSTDTAVRVLEVRISRLRSRLHACTRLAHRLVEFTRIPQGLLEECDDRPDVWHLLALAHHGACSFERARNCLDEAQGVRLQVYSAPRCQLAHTRVRAVQLLGTLPPADGEWLASELVQLRTAIDTSQAAWAEECGEDAEEEEDEAEPADVD